MADSDIIKPYRLQLEELKESQKNPYPTPPIGTPIVWYNAGRRDDPESEAAAIVTKVQDAGKICVVVFKPNAMPVHKGGVYFAEHPVHLQRSNPQTVNNGCWDYPKHAKIPKEHYEFHLAQLNSRIEATNQQIQTLSQAVEKPREPAKA